MTNVNSSAVEQSRRSRVSSGWLKLADPLILVTLGTFAVTQPLLSDFRAGAGFFVARRVGPMEIVLLVVVLTAVPGLIASLLVFIASIFSETARAVVQAGFVGLFLALISQAALVRLTSVSWAFLLVISVLIGLGVGLAYHRSKSLRSFLIYLIPAPLIFALFFLLTPPVSGLVLPRDSSAVALAGDVDTETPVIFVVLDEFPVVSLLDGEGQIDAQRYPNFADLASRSTWYKYTASAHDNTLWAVPALLTGQIPDSDLLPTADNYPGNLFTLLESSHDLHVIEPFTFLCPASACSTPQQTSFAHRFVSLLTDSVKLYAMILAPDRSSSVSVSDPFNEFLGGAMDRVNAEVTVDQAARFTEFLDGIETSPTGLHFVHLFLPHSPFHYYQSGAQYNDGVQLEGQESEVWTEPALADQAYQRHLLQVETVDRLIGDLLTSLDSQEAYDDAIVVVTADHGASFRRGTERRAITDANAYEVGMVPLFIKAPNQERGEVEEIPARTIDVLPTVADHLGVTLPWTHEGQSLLSDGRAALPLSVQSMVAAPVELDDVEDGVRAAIDHAWSTFEGEDGEFDLFAFGPHASLVGSTPDELANRSSGVTAQVDETSRLAHVDLGTGFVPGFIHGNLVGRVDADMHVAVSLNDEIRTVVPVFAVESDTARFTAILPETAFVQEFNELELLAVYGSSESAVVESIDVQGGTTFDMNLSADGSVTSLIDSDGVEWTIDTERAIVGFVDAANWLNSGFESSSPMDLQLQGWAVDTGAMAPAERVVFFVGGEYAGSAALDVQRPGVVDIYGSENVLASGFLTRLAHFSPSDGSRVQAFALSGDEAAELVIVDSALSAIAAG